LPGFGSVRA